MSVLNLYLKKCTLIFLALQILNLSIYNTDFYDYSFLPPVAQQSEINPIDSLAELLIESVDGYQDAFPESNSSQGKHASDIKHNISFKMLHLAFFTRLLEKHSYNMEAGNTLSTTFNESYSFMFVQEIHHPPSFFRYS